MEIKGAEWRRRGVVFPKVTRLPVISQTVSNKMGTSVHGSLDVDWK